MEIEDEEINASLSDPEVTGNFALLTEKCGTSDVLQIQRIIDSLRASDKTLQAEKQKCEDFLKEISNREIKLTESRKHKQDLFDNLNKEHNKI